MDRFKDKPFVMQIRTAVLSKIFVYYKFFIFSAVASVTPSFTSLPIYHTEASPLAKHASRVSDPSQFSA